MNPNESKIEGFLLIHNISKGKNIGTLIRSACAFNFSKIFIISKTNENQADLETQNNDNKKKKALKISKLRKEMGLFGNQGTDKQINFESFPSIQTAKEYFIANNIFVCGVEITQYSQSIVTHPFKGSTVFLLGNEGSGIHEKHKLICDHFVYIPQYTEKTASLNVAISGSIVFHHFAVWAGFKETPIYGEKFQPQKTLTEKHEQSKKIEIDEEIKKE